MEGDLDRAIMFYVVNEKYEFEPLLICPFSPPIPLTNSTIQGYRGLETVEASLQRWIKCASEGGWWVTYCSK